MDLNGGEPMSDVTVVLDLSALDRAFTRLAASEPVAANLVQLRHFGGMQVAEAAHILGLSRRNDSGPIRAPGSSNKSRTPNQATTFVKNFVAGFIVNFAVCGKGRTPSLVAEHRTNERAACPSHEILLCSGENS
jgi:ECF sigma factor